MKSHTLILTSPKIHIPEIKIVQFIKELIVSNLLNVDYFGAALNNETDYKEIAARDTNTTFITFHFEDSEIDYSSYSEDVLFQLIYSKLDPKNIGQVIVSDKDIEIYIN